MLDYYSDPANIQVFSDSGVGDMGSLAIDTDANHAARFGLTVPYIPSFIRVHFSGTGATLANVLINIDSMRGERHDTILHTVKKRGLGVDVTWRVELHEMKDWILQGADALVLTYTNPHAGDLAWGIETGLIPVRRNG